MGIVYRVLRLHIRIVQSAQHGVSFTICTQLCTHLLLIHARNHSCTYIPILHLLMITIEGDKDKGISLHSVCTKGDHVLLQKMIEDGGGIKFSSHSTCTTPLTITPRPTLQERCLPYCRCKCEIWRWIDTSHACRLSRVWQECVVVASVRVTYIFVVKEDV